MWDHTEAENLMFMSLSAQFVRAERTKVLRKQTTEGKKLFNKQMGHRKIKYFIENRD